jgi:hypothetical protein
LRQLQNVGQGGHGDPDWAAAAAAGWCVGADGFGTPSARV